MTGPTTLQMVASKALGGAERWFVRFAAALARRGAPASVAVRRAGALAAYDFAPLPVHLLPFHTTWDPLSRRAVERLLVRQRPDIVQTYMGRATRLTRTAGSARPLHLARLGGYYALGPYRHADGWIGNTRGLCDWLVRNGLPAGRVHHIYNFAEAPRPWSAQRVADCRVRFAIPDDAWVLVALGRFVPVKGQRYLIDALARLPDTVGGRPLRLVLVGDGPLAPELRRQAEQSGLAGRIFWPGWQADPAPWLQMADLVVFPSLEAETLGNVILEAWAWRRPLLTAAFRGARELVRHGEDAWCVPCADARALAAGIATLLADQALRHALVASGAQRIEREFSEAAIMARYLELYTMLAGG